MRGLVSGRVRASPVRVSGRSGGRQDGFSGVLGMGNICVPKVFRSVRGTSGANTTDVIHPITPHIAASYGHFVRFVPKTRF